MKNWILILALVGLHGCKVFNHEVKTCPKIDFPLYGYQSDIEELPDNSGNTFHGLFILHVLNGEEEHDFSQLASYFIFKDFQNPFLYFKENFSYCLRRILHKWRIPIYIVSKRLIV